MANIHVIGDWHKIRVEIFVLHQSCKFSIKFEELMKNLETLYKAIVLP